MSWLILAVSGVLEAVWATALGRSAGLTRPVPSVVFVLALIVSMAGLGHAMKTLPVSTCYAVWVGIGAVLTVVFQAVSGEGAPTPWGWLFVAGIVACIVGLKTWG